VQKMAMRRISITTAAFYFAITCSLSASTPPRLVNPGDWLLKREAPTGTLKRGERAMTALDLTIDPDGSVAKCEIVHSSNSPELDEYACMLFRINARYEPESGNQPIASRKRRDFWIWEASRNALDYKLSKASSAIRWPGSATWITT
jgi:TonB family protein